MPAMTARDFEQRYRDYADPWSYRTSEYERAKYEATLDACGPGPFQHALELGGSIGVFSARLAPRCRSLTTIDFSPSAVRRARAELAEHPQARAILGEIPAAIVTGPHDLVLASEILYYLDAAALAATMVRLEQSLAPGGRLVCVHWRTPGPERPSTAEHVHLVLRNQPWLRHLRSDPTDDYLLDVLERL
jgi:SAM-dependent methyltransferase